MTDNRAHHLHHRGPRPCAVAIRPVEQDVVGVEGVAWRRPASCRPARVVRRVTILRPGELLSGRLLACSLVCPWFTTMVLPLGGDRDGPRPARLWGNMILVPAHEDQRREKPLAGRVPALAVVSRIRPFEIDLCCSDGRKNPGSPASQYYSILERVVNRPRRPISVERSPGRAPGVARSAVCLVQEENGGEASREPTAPCAWP